MEKFFQNKKMLYTTLIILGVIFISILSLFVWKVFFDKPTNNFVDESYAAQEIPEGYFDKVKYEYTHLKNMKAITVVPKADIYKDEMQTQQQLEEQVNKLFQDIKKLGFNSVIVDTKREQSVIFKSEILSSTQVDLLKIIVDKAKEQNISVVAIYNITGFQDKDGMLVENHISFDNKHKIVAAAEELINNYEVDSVLLDGYYTKKSSVIYKQFVEAGSPEEYKQWLLDNSTATVEQVSQTIKDTKNSIPVGLYVDSVWANQSTNASGSKTTSDFESLTTGNVDTKHIIESGIIDFINIKIDSSLTDTKKSFKNIVEWWSSICQNGNIPFYVTHYAQNATTKLPGWNGTDQLAKQVAVALAQPQYYGSSFLGYDSLMSDPSGSTTMLVKYYSNEYKESDLMTGLTVSEPKKTQFTTYESSVVFKGKFDPTQEVKLNGVAVKPVSSGAFSEWVELNVGKNTITFEHKGETQTYVIERRIDVIKDVSPTGKLEFIGGSKINVNAKAYRGSTITAKLNGKTITLKESESGESDDKTSDYVTYKGAFVAPEAKNTVQNLGQIVVNGSHSGYRDSQKGATVTIQKAEEVEEIPPLGDAVAHVVANKTYTEVYAFKAPDDYPEGELYQLPMGTMDIIQSEMVWKNKKVYNLRSGKTVKADEVTIQNVPFVGNNELTSVVSSVENNKTFIKVKQKWKAPFSVWFDGGYPNNQAALSPNYKFNSSNVILTFDYATDIAQMQGDIASSPLFSAIKCEKVFDDELKIYKYKMTLTLEKSGCYYGVHTYYEGDTLVFAFNNPASNLATSQQPLSGLKIVVDPGHGLNSGSGYFGVMEDTVNFQLATKIQAGLKAKGATVIMTKDIQDKNPTLQARVSVGHANRADMLISVHHNAGPQSASGVETHYNAPFSQPLAEDIQSQIKSHFTKDRGIKNQNNFTVARNKQFPSVLVEYGFMSNKDELMNYIVKAEHQQKVADSTVNAIINYYKRK